MQIKIGFSSERDITLPIHYNNIIQAFIYNNIDDKLAEFLHNRGYISNSRSFKLFTFSRILNRGKKESNKFNFGKRIDFIVSSPLDDFSKSIANFMLQRNDLYLGQNNIKTEQIQIFNSVIDKDEITVDTLSSIVAYSTLLKSDGSKYTCYFTPRETDFNRIITENLVKKYNALNNTSLSLDSSIELIPIGQSRQNIIYYKNIIIKGASGKFLIKGDRRLLQMGLDAGFGSKNSQGFGCVKII
ncbi:CRISPR-associated endoribonuclease Cas6 [Tissierella carlieri]|uniref:CRISPR-associated endoribonuclease Cas6 n=1 Tax=Tissierella carlieri TaxID=689904 RepID=UPI001C1223DE|nr:CRISPR-associated endoribonuclease Cas6 [Tissierella carlieri]MBU5312829.1 CRISPR-associated endoribonuclease Cas6 [Tissierella carlieri]